MVRWWWPGGDVTAEELRREVRVLDKAGFGGAEIQAFRIGLRTDVPVDVAARVNDYPTPSFYGKVRAAAEEARERGLFLDLTLGSVWPFGGGDIITPELASIELRFTRKAISGPSHFHDRIVLPPPRPTAGMNLVHLSGLTSDALPSGWQERLRARTRIVAILALSGTEPVVEMKEAAFYVPDLDYSRWVDGPSRATVEYDYINDDALANSKVRDGKLVVPSGAAYQTLVLPSDSPRIRKRFPGLQILIGDLPS